ncbi:DELTA-alicitoxin-Pse2b-like [Bolinopsis microptera]|uniref:DELTA-alicitoxin-Pse2b-like n=1 Tax=Bolinopsis microptera TaxID=2820187 RepID=UPI003079A9F7
MLVITISLAFLMSAVSADSTGLGQGFYLPALSLVEDNGYGKSVFEAVPPECIKPVPSLVNREEKTFFENTKSFYSKMGVESSLSGEVTDGFTLGASIQSASNSIDSETLDVKGMSLDVYAITGFWDFIPDCLTSVPLDDEFVAAFESLPAKIDDPDKSSSWYMYDAFLKTYGSHVTKRVSHGSKLTRYIFSKSSEKISSAQFLCKVCSTVKDLKLKYCSNFTAEDYAKVAHLATSEELTVKGGSAETRAKLMTNVTQELLETFLMEANLTDQPVSIQYESLWDLLRSRYLGSSHFVKSINLEAYYLGMLNTGCGFKRDGGVDLRKFVLVEDDPNVPGYECQLAPMGCRGDNDCHIGGAGSTCYCYGNSCVDSKSLSDPRHRVQEGRDIKREYDGSSSWDGVNWSCHYHIGIYCVCDKSWGGDWKTVWPSGRHGYRRNLESYREAQRKLSKFYGRH